MSLTAISPIDGRYAEETKELSNYFSEMAYLRYRVMLEIEYLIFFNRYLKPTKGLTVEQIKFLKSIYQNFSLKDAEEIKNIEQTINHDAKAVEYFLQAKLKQANLNDYTSFIHFALTSDDINNLAYRLMWQGAIQEIYLPLALRLEEYLIQIAHQYSKIPLLSLTHGQSATPTTLGKEFNVFVHRLKRQINQLETHKVQGKLNGATGTFAAHNLAYSEVDWFDFSKRFVNALGLEPNLLTTQIEPADSLAESYHIIFRINTILIDFSRDIWFYVSRGILMQQKKEEEIGSSTMPHKINPIQFENAEGNLGLANSYLNHLATNLPISRMQRDLSGSTIIRNQGLPLGYSLLAIKQILKGLSRIAVNKEKIENEIKDHWELLAEPIQTILRKYGDEQGYEKLKSATRGKEIDKKTIEQIINQSKIPQNEKEILLQLTPQNYLGLAKKLAEI